MVRTTTDSRKSRIGESRATITQRYLRYIRRHAPPEGGEYSAKKIVDAMHEDKRVPTLVMCVDMRKSTFLMKEAISQQEYAHTMNRFIIWSRRIIGSRRGYFDKFTGDGFLAYWPVFDYEQEGCAAALYAALESARALMTHFDNRLRKRFRDNSRNFAADVGLKVGLDFGSLYFVEIQGDITIVGAPVVGAVRMNSAARTAGEIIANCRVQKIIETAAEAADDNFAELVIDSRRETRSTKDIADQEMYLVRLAPDGQHPDRLDR